MRIESDVMETQNPINHQMSCRSTFYYNGRWSISTRAKRSIVRMLLGWLGSEIAYREIIYIYGNWKLMNNCVTWASSLDSYTWSLLRLFRVDCWHVENIFHSFEYTFHLKAECLPWSLIYRTTRMNSSFWYKNIFKISPKTAVWAHFLDIYSHHSRFVLQFES